MKKIDLSGKTAIITGATKGIGFSIAKNFLDCNANIIITGTSNIPKDRLLKKFGKTQSDQTINYYAVDFKIPDETNQFLEEIKMLDKIDICVNNAGTNHIKNINYVTRNDIIDLHSVNLYAPFLILSVVLEKMKENNWGRVVNIGSLWSKLSRVGRSMYSTSKFGLNGLTVTSALEYAKYNILVNMVSPGFINTDLSKKTLTKIEKEKIENSIPFGKFADPIAIADPVLFLCSELNHYISGQNIIIDGGYICE
tara:strand:- start:4915 stop:5673 length:759 start_codon:yes stop_codon:yes gene_type:complete